MLTTTTLRAHSSQYQVLSLVNLTFNMLNTRYKVFEKFEKDGVDTLHPITTMGEGTMRRASISDEVFSEITKGGPNYRAVLHPVQNVI